MSVNVNDLNLGHVSAYAYAKSTGRIPADMTEEQYAEYAADFIGAAERAVDARDAAIAAKSAAETAKNHAETAANQANGSATDAQDAANTASRKAGEASTYASNASEKASQAQTYASNAEQSSTAANASKEAAAASKTAAAESASKAKTSETNAAESKTAAAESAEEAKEAARTLTIDTTLTQPGQAAEAKKTGEKIAELKSQLTYSLKYITDVNWWIQNAINPNNGANYTSSNTIRLRSRITREDGIFAIKVLTGKIGLLAWDSDATYLGFWKNGTFQKSSSVSAAFVLTGEIDLTQFYDLGYAINIEYRTDDNADITPTTAYGNVSFVRSIAVDNAQTLVVKDVNARGLWEVGGIGSDGTNFNQRNYNIRTGYLENVNKITIAEGYRADVSTYDENKQFIVRRQSFTNEIYIDYDAWKCKYIRIELRGEDTTPLTDVDMYSNIELYAYLDTKLELDGLAADSGAVGKRFDAQFTNWMSQSRYSDTTNARILTLLHFSDVHNNLSAMKKAVSLIGQYSAKVDDAIHTGDVTLTNLGQGILNWIQSGCAESVLGVVGNHDTYADGNMVLNSATQEEVYNTLFANYISGWNVVQPTGVNDAESDYYCACYYYKDYTTPKIRLIVLDSERWDTNELTWFTATLDDARTNGYAVIVASHCAPGVVTGLHGNWNYIGVEDFDSSTPTYAKITDDAPDAVDAFVDAGGDFILWISGHFHRGGFGHLTNHPNIFVMVAEKASIERTSGAARISGESNEYAFNMLSVDASDKLVRMVRYGSNADAWLRPRNVFTYNYDTHTVIYEG